MTILEDLERRGLLADCTDREGLAKRLAEGPIVLYAGFDPTAESLHVGNLIPLLALRRFQMAGHHPIAVAGGATGLIGDPSGRSSERALLTPDALAHNIANVKEQLRRLLDFDAPKNPARLLDNASWTQMSYLDFLREIGKHISVNMMVSKESVRSRMEDREHGISYTEFSYMLLQAHDFYRLCRELNCELQIGGSDQWGNITAGIDLCRKKLSRAVFGLTLPLITNADGAKFGKSVSGAVWLDSAKTSVYRFYQFWVRVDDRDVIRYLKYFTFLPAEAIADLERQHAAKPEERAAHKTLAKELTCMVHSAAAADEAIRASEILFGGDLAGISERSFRDIAAEAPTARAPSALRGGAGVPLVELLVLAGLCASKGQARKDMAGGGIYLNNRRESDPQRQVSAADVWFGKYLLLRKGKRNYAVLTLENGSQR